ncbi:molybdenum cofactor biosynthesis protein C [Thecamonas trahens ATCC 50062]|uniref:Molybdenum cofactor biosynthesis protein C n=1 Tax=Thecamonas trahens ATCC 50062 TaxID=461836 RepID=A0A0L0DF39_THETB|nr:molybdenum cofactor biosynthesis protein C [Thecamonas trahens ATCC 50062]KNC49933.1 molybdenum cofactor biosynthesis protein C [Thecamonas trahens ATCC 50062]|eukprot:XP_013757411.1 molybdenum cofactor biosynthesis protein C [Thecamonas trahens ATCC 50062]
MAILAQTSGKKSTARSASAHSIVFLPAHLTRTLVEMEPDAVLSHSVLDPKRNPLLANTPHHNLDQPAADNDHATGPLSKGPVFATAVIAGTMAVKRTSDLIPMCHPLPITGVELDIGIDVPASALRIVCTVRVDGKTGVEMEALTGASAAALTVYDMTKALSHDIVIADTRLLAKDGGKSGAYRAPACI